MSIAITSAGVAKWEHTGCSNQWIQEANTDI